ALQLGFFPTVEGAAPFTDEEKSKPAAETNSAPGKSILETDADTEPKPRVASITPPTSLLELDPPPDYSAEEVLR
ncbi:MAG: hypothetical protein AAF483_29445, partial [Planctomycetota bacterium]